MYTGDTGADDDDGWARSWVHAIARCIGLLNLRFAISIVVSDLNSGSSRFSYIYIDYLLTRD